MRRSGRGLTVLLHATLVAALLSCTLAACGGADKDAKKGDSETSGGTGAGTGSGGTDYSVAGALAELPFVRPGKKNQLLVFTGDLARATRLAGVKRPTSADTKKRLAWLRALSGDVTLPGAASTGLNSVNVDPSGKWLGYTATDVRTFVELRNGRDRFSVQTLYDGAEVNHDLPTRSGLQATDKGKPGSRTEDPSTFAQFPLVQVLAQKGDQVAFSTDPAKVKQWRAGKGRRLDRNDALDGVATTLDGSSVYAAALATGPFAAARGGRGRVTLKQDFDAVGIGLALDGTHPIVYVSYHFPRKVAAGARQVTSVWKKGVSRRDNLPLSDYVKLRSTRRTGHVVTAELDASATGPQVVLQMLSSADTPFQDG